MHLRLWKAGPRPAHVAPIWFYPVGVSIWIGRLLFTAGHDRRCGVVMVETGYDRLHRWVRRARGAHLDDLATKYCGVSRRWRGYEPDFVLRERALRALEWQAACADVRQLPRPSL